MPRRRALLAFATAAVGVATILAGCGTTKQRMATEQLLLSDAVDQAISHIDFRSLAGRTVYLDTRYIREVKDFGFVNAEYVISSLRQQMMAARCLLQDSKETADIIVEARLGTLGTNGHELVYGLPQTTLLSAASSFLPNTPPLPVIPEISVGRSERNAGVAKLAVFAYEKLTRQPLWQSGLAKAESTSRSSWLLGAGPFQRGSIYEGYRFAGTKLTGDDPENEYNSLVPYYTEHQFPQYSWQTRPQVSEAAGQGELK